MFFGETVTVDSDVVSDMVKDNLLFLYLTEFSDLEVEKKYETCISNILAWLLILYTGLALRENILRVNGSDIRPWWIKHHYFAMAMALISLTWETHKQRGVQLFLQWAIMQGVAMLLQNRYQRQRLCTHIALGKARRMDVVWGETAGVDGQLWLLAPILFILQVVTCGVLLIVMAVGNFANTVQTLVAKS
ncbi:transmembrane protein 120 homolog [Camellia sinensis]|uniref:transmembrane protein 120 homolog n=1 Tax=Camellia sinensis TaxID=4442 RepID=UPI001035EAE7|nr:transmembrane protein 120 homolog [Camellia sinensis]